MSDIIDAILMRLTEGLKCRPIPREGRLYLDRHYLFTVFGCEVFLHRYLKSDGEKHLHNHPSWGLGIPICGGYTEEILRSLCHRDGMIVHHKKVRPWLWNWIGTAKFHRIVWVEPDTWTLFIMGPRWKGWGFLSEPTRTGPRGPIAVFYQPYASEEDTFDWSKEMSAYDVRRQRVRERLARVKHDV